MFSSFSNLKVHGILRRIKDIFNVTLLLLAMYFCLARTLSNLGDVSLWSIETLLRVLVVSEHKPFVGLFHTINSSRRGRCFYTEQYLPPVHKIIPAYLLVGTVRQSYENSIRIQVIHKMLKIYQEKARRLLPVHQERSQTQSTMHLQVIIPSAASYPAR